MHGSLDLFDEGAVVPSTGAQAFHDTVSGSGFRLEELDIGDVTFLKGQEESVHRWYRLTPSYSPELVRYFLKEFAPSFDQSVLDPFSGRGTTVVEAQKHGIQALGIEINPLLQRVGEYSLSWTALSSVIIKSYLAKLTEKIEDSRDLSPDEVAAKLKTEIPIIHDVYRWWQPKVLRDLMIARELAENNEFAEVRRYLWLAINTASLECANIHRNHPTITFDDNHTRNISVLDEVSYRLRHIEADVAGLTEAQRGFIGTGQIVLGDARALDRACGARKFDYVITSPPYPNRFSYIHQTRPQLHFMEILQTRSQATDIDLQTIGGTWGKATSNLMKGYIEPPEDLRPLLTYENELLPKNLLMCNYANKYFTDLDEHVKSLKSVVNDGFRGAYVVGNSRLSGVEIYTECILASIFERHGFTVEKILMFRKRGGRKRLYETAVCVRL